MPAPANDFVRARIDPAVKAAAADVLKDLGLTVSDVVRMVLTRVATEGALPFALDRPNAATRAAMEEARSMAERGARFASAEALINDIEENGR